ncbi:MAG: metallopeptidase TldD-related protein [Deltaproteobacteria bacterium]|nr:metallopeptidase TldD-related protein [Deltaproteobacteria bacterium]
MTAALPAEEAVARAVRRALDAGAHAADAALAESDSFEARVRAREIDFVKQARERVLGIRAFVAGAGGLRTALTSTSDLSPDTIDRMARETVALARATAPDPAAGLPDGGFAGDRPELALLAPEDRHVSVEARVEEARRAEAAARALDPRIVNSEGSQVASGFRRTAYANSAGFAGSYESASHSLFCEPVARQGEAMQRDYWMTAARRLGALEDAGAVGRRAAERALRRLGARPVATCEVPVIFEPMVARSLLGQLAGCVAGSAVYRDATFLKDRMGEPIASELVTVIDDGRLPGGLGSRPFDGEGLPTRRNVLVEGGRLRSWLLDGYSARKLGLRSTGNAVRGAAGAPGPGPTNLWLEPGKLPPEEIVRRTGRGLLVTELIGMGFNPVTGDYSRGAAGLWIEDGRPVHAVEEVTIAGHLGDMLAAIDLVGSDLVWLGAIAAPTLRVARMTVAGR